MFQDKQQHLGHLESKSKLEVAYEAFIFVQETYVVFLAIVFWARICLHLFLFPKHFPSLSGFLWWRYSSFYDSGLRLAAWQATVY